MVTSTTILSKTLRSITVTKIHELRKQRNTYNARKQKILDAANEHSDVQERVSILHKSLEDLKLCKDPAFKNIKHWLDQSRFDSCISKEKLAHCEDQLIQRLEVESRKLELADLYSRLLTEWIEQSGNVDTPSDESESTPEDGDAFEVVQSAQRERLDQLREKFARVVFEPLETDEAEVDRYLQSLFEGENGKKALKSLRNDTEHCTSNLRDHVIDHQTLLWTIKALQKNDLLNDEKKAILQEFLQDDAVLREIRDVLNMRLKDIDNWSWDMGDEGLPVAPRQSLNGKWRVMVDEDVMHALLTHYIGTTWAVKFKQLLQRLTIFQKIWKEGCVEPHAEQQKREYFGLTEADFAFSVKKGVEKVRLHSFREDFFLSPLPSKQFEEAGGYDDDDKDNNSDRKSAVEIKQQLLRTLATEVLLRRTLDGEVAVVQSDFQWFATGIPHSTIFATLRFMGFSPKALEFIRKVLEPPLDMLDGSPVRTRKRGLPMAHVLEKLFGEIVLFFMDLAVNKESSQILYRFHDDLWLVGKPSRCAQGWGTMERFAKVMGLEFNFSKTGSVYLSEGTKKKDPAVSKALPEGPVTMDFLFLDPTSGEWKINHDHVQMHVKQLQKQLGEAKSVLEWIKTWNSCIGRFFGYTFGEPAQCFGISHLNAILETHNRMQQFLFDGKNGNGRDVSSHVKQMIATKFSVSADSVPDAFLYLPDTLGGLGLKNPFINLCFNKENLVESPSKLLQDFLEKEKEFYQGCKKYFGKLSERERRKKWKEMFEGDDDAEAGPPLLSWSDAQTFPSLEEYTKYREVHSLSLTKVYNYLMETPYIEEIDTTRIVDLELKDLQSRLNAEVVDDDETAKDLREDKELLWLLEYYVEDLMREFNGLCCVNKDLLPLGVLGVMRKKKVTWQMVL